jgi:hypothetical protein
MKDPASQSFELTATLDDASILSSRDEAGVSGSQDDNSRKTCKSRGLNAELRNIIQSLQRQLEQQRQVSEHRMGDIKEREAVLAGKLEIERVYNVHIDRNSTI